MGTKVTLNLTREDDEDYIIRASLTPGRRATRLDPPEDPELDILEILDADGRTVDLELSDEEMDHLIDQAGDIARDAYMAAMEDAADARRDR